MVDNFKETTFYRHSRVDVHVNSRSLWQLANLKPDKTQEKMQGTGQKSHP